MDLHVIHTLDFWADSFSSHLRSIQNFTSISKLVHIKIIAKAVQPILQNITVEGLITISSFYLSVLIIRLPQRLARVLLRAG